MYSDLNVTQSNLSRMSSQEAATFFAGIAGQSRNNLVNVQWSVTYDELGHDMHSVADVSLVHASDALLQVWLKNAAGGIWIPEMQPWEISVVEFKPQQAITSAKVGLLDSKWTSEDIGRTYHYQLWGYLVHAGKVESFALEKWAAYPGDA